MKLLTVTAFLLLLAGYVSAQCPADIPWSLISGRCMVCGLEPKSFEDASAYCEGHGGTVGPILDLDQQNFAESCSSDVTTPATANVWTGLRSRHVAAAPDRYWHVGPPYAAPDFVTVAEDSSAVAGCYAITADDTWTLYDDNCDGPKLFFCIRPPVTCEPLLPPPNTEPLVYLPATTPHYVDTVVTYSCADGFVLSGDSSTRTCLSDGTWSPQRPTCVPVDCGPLAAPPQGAVEADATTYNSVATYSCALGFAIAGVSPTRTCLADATWSGTDLTCTIVDCGVLPNPENGVVTAASTVFGSVSIYSCDDGYTMDGAAERTCLATSFWVPEAPLCVAEDSKTLEIALGASLGGLVLLGVIATVVLLLRRPPVFPRPAAPLARRVIPRPPRPAPRRLY